jgi:acyl carrier protein
VQVENRDSLGSVSDGLVGRTVALRPLTAGDYGPLHEMATTGRAAVLWRLRGRSVSPDAFTSLLWSDCLCQFAIVSASAKWSTAGLISAFNHDPVSGTAYLSVLTSSELAGETTVAGEAIILFVRYLKAAFSLRKLYAESSALALTGLDAIVERFGCVREEGRLRDHMLIDGRYCDLVVLALYVDELLQEAESFSRYISGTGSGRVATPAPTYPEFLAYLRKVFDLAGDAEIVGGTTLKDDLGVDSLSMLELITDIEARFGIVLPDEGILRVRSVQDLYTLVTG